jgi:putative oxidoreductase
MKAFFDNFITGRAAVGLLFLRLVVGLAMVLHGLPKIQKPFSWMDRPGAASPVPDALQALAAVSEFGGGLALMAGLLTPLACFGIMSTMFVAILSHLQRATPKEPQFFVKPPGAEGGSYETAALFFVVALALFLTGPGILSLDAQLFGRNRGQRKR